MGGFSLVRMTVEIEMQIIDVIWAHLSMMLFAGQETYKLDLVPFDELDSTLADVKLEYCYARSVNLWLQPR